MFYLMPPRHISTLPFPNLGGRNRDVRFTPMSGHRQRDLLRPKSAREPSFQQTRATQRATLGSTIRKVCENDPAAEEAES